MTPSELELRAVTYKYTEPDCLSSMTAIQRQFEEYYSCFKAATRFQKDLRGGRNQVIRQAVEKMKLWAIKGNFVGLEANRSMFFLHLLEGHWKNFVNCEKSADFERYENQVPYLRRKYPDTEVIFQKTDIYKFLERNPGKFACIDNDTMIMLKPHRAIPMAEKLERALHDDPACVITCSGVGRGLFDSDYAESRALLYQSFAARRQIYNHKSIKYKDKEGRGGIPMRAEIFILGKRIYANNLWNKPESLAK